MQLSLIIWSGCAVTILGLGGLVYSILEAARLRKTPLPEDKAQAKLHSLVYINMAAVGLAGFGLALVVFGLILD